MHSSKYILSFVLMMLMALLGACGGTSTSPSTTPITTPKTTVIYIPQAGGDTVGKDVFTLKVSNRDGTAATGLASSIVLNPVMVMGASSDGTIWPNAVVETGTPGTYTGTVYYSMATSGTGMYWKLNVAIGSDNTELSPNVVLTTAASDTKSVKFSYATDTKSSYQVWRDPLAGTNGNYDFTVFISSTDGANTYPVYAGQTWTTAPPTLTTVTLQASTNGTTWVPMTPVGTNTGRYMAIGLNLMQSMQMPVYIKLSINGNIYTTNGLVYDDGISTTSNAVQTFNVTP